MLHSIKYNFSSLICEAEHIKPRENMCNITMTFEPIFFSRITQGIELILLSFFNGGEITFQRGYMMFSLCNYTPGTCCFNCIYYELSI